MVFPSKSGNFTLSAHCISLKSKYDQKQLLSELKQNPGITISNLMDKFPGLRACWEQANMLLKRTKTDAFIISNGADGFCVLVLASTSPNLYVRCTSGQLPEKAQDILCETWRNFFELKDVPSCVELNVWETQPTHLFQHPETSLWPLLCTQVDQPFASRTRHDKTNGIILAFWRSLCSATK